METAILNGAFAAMLVGQAAPYAVQLLFCLGLVGLGLRGEGNGWRFITAAGAVYALRLVTSAYMMFIVRPGMGGHLASVSMLSMAGAVLGAIGSGLLLAGLALLSRRGTGAQVDPSNPNVRAINRAR